MVKRALETKVTVLDLSQDNMIWLKFDKSVFCTEKDVVFCALYACPYDSPYYQQDHVTVQSTLSLTEQCLINYIEQYDDSCFYLLCGDFNARTGDRNVVHCDDDDDDVQSVVQSDLYCPRQSQDKVINMFGRLLLEMCATCNICIFNGSCRGDENGDFTYVCSSGSSTLDYYVASRELVGDVVLEVAERFESKHMPVQLTFNPRRTDESVCKTKFIEKTVWDETKLPLFHEAIKSTLFQSAIVQATALLHDSVDAAVDCFNSGLLSAAACMKRKIYVGPRQSKWYDMECKTAKRNTRKWWRLFRRSRCEQGRASHRHRYVESRKTYRFVVNAKRVAYKQKKIENLVAKAKDSKLFWSEVRSVCQSSQRVPNISTEQWFVHFKSVFNDVLKPQSNQQQLHHDPGSVEGLDEPISAQEVLDAIRHLNLNKAPGHDGILAGMLKFSVTQMLPFIVELFNHVFDTGNYPAAWTGAIVVPIHKSGDVDKPDNYRGVSLLSILGKVFAHILNKRLSSWADANEKIDEVQSGFRKGYSTIDNIFVLYSVVQKYLLRRSGKVYVCFVDFKKAFDCVNRAVLWNTLRKAGVGGKMLQTLKSMYGSVRACIRCPDSVTDFFDCPVGVRQGCVLSPTLFSFLINELALEISAKGMHGVQLSPDVIQILIILFADDVALTSFSIAGLQKQIDILKSFADNFDMCVNMSKTKIIVFRKGGFLAEKERWTYGNELIEVVNSYKYLGMSFTTKLSLTQAVSDLAVKAKARTARILRCLFRLGEVPSSVFFQIFDAQITPVLMYGAEVWGFHQFSEIEKVHLFACKRFLRVGVQTPNKMVYGDLGRYPLYVVATVKFVKYWLRLITMPRERLPFKAFVMSCTMCDSGRKSWAFHLRNVLCENGFTDAWQQQSVGDVKMFLCTLKGRLIERFQQDWINGVNASDRFQFYAQFKRSFKIEPYVNCSQLRCFKIAYVQFRFGISPINFHRMRYRKGVTPQQMFCPVCRDVVEDENHILFECPLYDDLRHDMSFFQANQMNDVVTLMNANDDTSVMELSRFLYTVFKRRLQPVQF